MKDKEKNFVSAMIYVHNAERRIGDFLAMILKTLEGDFENSEVVCVNDGSDDGSAAEVRRAGGGAGSVSVSLLDMSYFHGLELAMNAGRDLAIGDYVFEFDDISPGYGPDEIMRVYRRALEGYDVVSAVPDGEQRFSSRMFYCVFNHFTERAYPMRTESFRILSRRVINRKSDREHEPGGAVSEGGLCQLRAEDGSHRVSGGEDRAEPGQGGEEIQGPSGHGRADHVHGCGVPVFHRHDRSS